jgi:hypothetical protein
MFKIRTYNSIHYIILFKSFKRRVNINIIYTVKTMRSNKKKILIISITYGGFNLKSPFLTNIISSQFSNLFHLLAEELGIKDLVPPYLDPHLQPQDLLTGVCFASGGAGYDPLTSEIAVRTYI